MPIFFMVVTAFGMSFSPVWAALLPQGLQNLDSIQSRKTPRIRVRVIEGQKQFELRGLDLYFNSALTKEMSRWKISCDSNQIRLIKEGGVKKQYVSKNELQIHSPTGFIHLAGRPFRDQIRIVPTKKGCDVVNDVDLESYLDALVNSEISSSWSEEAIAAQVIAARSYAIYRMSEQTSSYYDVDSTEKDQMYEGSAFENVRSRRIVEKTKGLVLASITNGHVLKAFYHSTCGGMTEVPEHVWGKHLDGFKRSVVCSYCGSSPRFQWEIDLKTSEIKNAIYENAPNNSARNDWQKNWPKNWKDLLRSKELMNIRSLRQPNGRVAAVITEWGSALQPLALKIPSNRFRSWLGVSELRSTAFQVFTYQPKGQERRWRFEGRGNGHGVGMCQWGAKVMGEKGYSASAILKQYYPGAILKRLW